MKEMETEYGKVYILNRDQIFQKKIEIIKDVCAKTKRNVTIGLAGGSTPKEFYKWVVTEGVFNGALLDQIVWMVCDERWVPLESDESNFGNAERLMLNKLGVSMDKKRPWKVELSPEKAAAAYNNYFTGKECFDLCLLGMGDDCHIASIFPGSALMEEDPISDFVAIEVPEKGVRLTITPNGLRRSLNIVMLVTGKGKSLALKKVLEGKFDSKNKPAQLNKEWFEKVVWLVDNEAASELSL